MRSPPKLMRSPLKNDARNAKLLFFNMMPGTQMMGCTERNKMMRSPPIFQYNDAISSVFKKIYNK